MRPPQGFEWLLILFIILLLFGAKRLPDMARGVGRSLRILKAETRGLTDDDGAAATSVEPLPASDQVNAPSGPDVHPAAADPSPPQASKPTT